MYKPIYMLEPAKARAANNAKEQGMSLKDEMRNQQENGYADAARIAMFLDTDGWVTMAVTQRMKHRDANLNPFLGMVNTSEPLVSWADAALTRMGVPHYVRWYDLSKYKCSRSIRPQGRISVTGAKRNLIFLPMVIPYLIAKKTQAELIWEWILSRAKKSSRDRYDQRELEIANAVRELNANKGDNWRPISSESIRQAHELRKELSTWGGKMCSDLQRDLQSAAEMAAPSAAA